MTIAKKLTYLAETKAAIKDAIEAKGVTVGNIPFRQYADKIALIEGEGGGEITGDYIVRFIDYDGTILQVSGVDDGGDVTPPTPPVYDDLVFWKWNYPTTNIKSNLDIGALYKTVDDKTHIHTRFTVVSGKEITLYFDNLNEGTLSIDWGDSKSNNYTDENIEATHEYDDYGDYIIKITCDEQYGMVEVFEDEEDLYDYNIMKFYASTKLVALGDYCLSGNYSLISLSLPALETLGDYCLSYNYSLIEIVIDNILPPTLTGTILFYANLILKIYVPDDYVNVYKEDVVWLPYADYIYPISGEIP